MPRTVFTEANIGAFLDMLAVSEIGRAMLKESDDGYNVIVGSRPGSLITFSDYSKHPNRRIEWKPGEFSTAAGRYQILYRYWPHYRQLLKLPDFGPESQDAYAVQQIKEQRAYRDVIEGRILSAMRKCRNIWASLPGAGYGQHENKADNLVAAYKESGGVVSTLT